MQTRAHTVPRFYLNGFVAQSPNPRHDPYLYIAQIATGEVKRRAPKNVSISNGLYDGVGALAQSDATIEAHLAKIEWAAASGIRKLLAAPQQNGVIPPEVWRFIAWQAARTPGFMRLEAAWASDWDPNESPELVEPPPVGIEGIMERPRPILLEQPTTGEEREVLDVEEFKLLHREGWRWKLRKEDHLEMLHMQAWYFQVRHFPRLSWTRLAAPPGTAFITSDRAVSWIVDGVPDTPPAALRHETAQLVAPLTGALALVGRNATGTLNVTPREVNQFIASATDGWIAGSSLSVVEQALADRTVAYASDAQLCVQADR